jgi:hypothetical protein
MICPSCGALIPEQKIREEFGRRGGKKSRRTISPETAREMQTKAAEARRRKRKDKFLLDIVLDP